jgi:DNA-directed RNA polymerase specialized sigma24 family protein
MARTIIEREQAAKEIAERLARRDPNETDWQDAGALHRVSDAFRATVDADMELARAVAAARVGGFSWAAIAAMLGVSKQTAQQRFGDSSN